MECPMFAYTLGILTIGTPSRGEKNSMKYG